MGQYCILLRIFFTADKYIYVLSSINPINSCKRMERAASTCLSWEANEQITSLLRFQTFYAHEVDEVYLHINESLYRVTG